MKKYLGFFKFYQPKATGGGFLIFEWTLPIYPFFKKHFYPLLKNKIPKPIKMVRFDISVDITLSKT
jgi:hypothetical protein